ncbi:hypothetical protein [Sphingobacterium faecium]|uniref:hypothetical protein n=1 Tax=Sphingobacterium faecium TaxID=34087 RepID=UPI002468DCE9|nr:hypothetical protein [Sphingobacterium faecium]MDH5825771.1 hypothetical protein [Sphingobacterium faecium]
MNRTTIQLNGKSVDILFGCWAVGLILKSGVKLEEIGSEIFEHLPTIAYFGACNAAGRSLVAYEKDDFLDLSPAELMPILTVFTNSMTQDVPVQKKEQVKAETKPKTTKK